MEQASAQRREDPVAVKLGLMNLLAAVAVMYIHAEVRAQFGFSAESWCGVAESEIIGACEWAVPFFFLTSAFRFFRGFTWSALLPKWKRRVKTLLIPYLAWNALYVALFALLPRIPFFARFVNAPPAPLTFAEILKGVLLHRYAGHFWFLGILLLFLLCAPAFYAVFSRRYIAEAAVVVLFALMMLRPPLLLPIPYFSWRGLFFYGMGAYLALRRPAWAAASPGRCVRRCLLLLVPVTVAANAFFDTELYSIAMIALLWYGLCGERLRPLYAYACTFFLYASHILMLSVLKKIALAFLPHTQLFALLTYLAVPLIALPPLVCLAWLIERYLPRTAALMTGGRSQRR